MMLSSASAAAPYHVLGIRNLTPQRWELYGVEKETVSANEAAAPTNNGVAPTSAIQAVQQGSYEQIVFRGQVIEPCAFRRVGNAIPAPATTTSNHDHHHGGQHDAVWLIFGPPRTTRHAHESNQLDAPEAAVHEEIDLTEARRIGDLDHEVTTTTAEIQQLPEHNHLSPPNVKMLKFRYPPRPHHLQHLLHYHQSSAAGGRAGGVSVPLVRHGPAWGPQANSTSDITAYYLPSRSSSASAPAVSAAAANAAVFTSGTTTTMNNTSSKGQREPHAYLILLPPTGIASSWMSRLPNATQLAALSIPGTHNSHTYFRALPSVRCQAVDVATQLANGVRFLDIRVAVTPAAVQATIAKEVSLAAAKGPGQTTSSAADIGGGGIADAAASLILVHGAFPATLPLVRKQKSLRHILDQVYAFLDGAGRGECVLISIKPEGSCRGNRPDMLDRVLRASVCRDVRIITVAAEQSSPPPPPPNPHASGGAVSLLTAPTATTTVVRPRWWTAGRLPTVGEARGMCVLMRRFHASDEPLVLSLPSDGSSSAGPPVIHPFDAPAVTRTITAPDPVPAHMLAIVPPAAPLPGFGINAAGWPDNCVDGRCEVGDGGSAQVMRIQDWYGVEKATNIPRKTQLAVEHLQRAATITAQATAREIEHGVAQLGTKEPRPLFLNFLTGSNFFSAACWPEMVAAQVNPEIVRYLCSRHGVPDDSDHYDSGDAATGIVVADWVGRHGDWDLVRLVLGMNARMLAAGGASDAWS